MTTGMNTVIFPVTDLDAAKAVFTRLLGVAPQMDQPYYVGFGLGDQHVGLDPHGHAKGMTGPLGYWHVDDIATVVASLVAAGATVVQPAHDVGGGTLVATLGDPDGNPIGVRQDAAGSWS
jgi:predicted enzyme related to lactoylglutathione lyase